MIMAISLTITSFDVDPTKSFPLRQAGKAVAQQLGKLVEANVKSLNMTGWISGIVDKLADHHSPLTDHGVHMVRSLLDSGLGASEITWFQILPTVSELVANQAQAVSLI